MYINSFSKTLLFFVSILIFVSCDKDYSTVGDTLIGGNNFELVQYNSPVVTYNNKVPVIQSSNLPVNAFGIYDNPAFGKTTASFVTQLSLPVASLSPTFGSNVEIESVYLDVPYFVDVTKTKAIIDAGVGAGSTYVLESIYGDKMAKIKLSVYESDRYMGNQDGKTQNFYSNQTAEFDKFIKPYGNDGRLNNDTDKTQNDEFFFSSLQTTVETKDAANKSIFTYLVPGMRLKLNATFFIDKIFNAPKIKLSNQREFQEHVRGLYFKVEQSGSDKGSLAMINFSKGTITIKYKEDSTTTPVTKVEKSFVINLSGNTANLLENIDKTDYANAVKNPNVVADKKLYLKGGEGAVAVIDLFVADIDKNGVPDELEKMRKEGWLINEANLVFNIDSSADAMGFLDPSTNKPFIPEPDQLFLYDYSNSRAIVDYTTNLLYGGGIIKDATTSRGTSYKFIITDHVRNLVKNVDAKNSKLGLSVTQSIINSNFSKSEPPSAFQAPTASVMHPLGTVLIGNNSLDETKKLKLEIFYTKPK